MILNINIGLLGHVDSGKTTLARALSTISSTAAFDKNPQSQERGITLDLGFSALLTETPEHLKTHTEADQIQLTFVDCPGHASLIRTIIGGAQIIDLMLLVVDAQKGIQTQTAECLVIGELTCKHLVVAINKIDLVDDDGAALSKLENKLRKVLGGTVFGKDVPILKVSALTGTNLLQFVSGLMQSVFVPARNVNEPFLFYVDHCFPIKGQGTVCTGTVLQGKVSINDTVEIPAIKEQRKVKSIQMFKKPFSAARQGDRIGLCVTQFNSSLMERGIIAKPGYVLHTWAAIIKLSKIKYYKPPIKSKSKYHITIGHETVMAKLTLFRSENSDCVEFDFSNEYIFVDELSEDGHDSYALVEFETSPLATSNSLLIGSKLDMDAHTNSCRMAFHGSILWLSHSPNYQSQCLTKLKLFKKKSREGTVQRVVNENELIVQNLFKKECSRDLYVGKKVQLSTGEEGVIDSPFGQTSKVKVFFVRPLAESTIRNARDKRSSVKVFFNYKKFVFNKKREFVQ